MRKLALLAAAVAVILAVALPLSFRFLGSDERASAQGDTVDFDIDPDISGNTASSIGAGGVEDCLRVDVAPENFGDGLADVTIDVVVQGDTLAPLAYDAWIIYEPTKVDPVTWDDFIKLPGAWVPLTSKAPPQLNAGALNLEGVPGTPGDGTLVRIDLDVISAGVTSFGFAKGAYHSEAGVHPSTTGAGALAINEDCPPVPPAPPPGPSPTPVQPATPPATPTRVLPPQPRTEAVRYRWVNVSIEVPPRSSPADIKVSRHEGLPDIYSPSPGTMVPGLRIFKDVAVGEHIESSNVFVDAITGQVVHEDVLPEHQAEFDAVLATLRLEGPEPPDVWPYSSTLPDRPRERMGNITYVEPDPTSGIKVAGMLSDGPQGSAISLIISNGRSKRYIDAETGQVIVDDGERVLDQVDERDREAFDRFTSSIRVLTK